MDGLKEVMRKSQIAVKTEMVEVRDSLSFT